MSQASGLPLEELRQYMFLYHDREATEHIMRVSGGLDSLVMGEGQILAQVPPPPPPHTHTRARTYTHIPARAFLGICTYVQSSSSWATGRHWVTF